MKIPFESKLVGMKDIAARNAVFRLLTPNQKRKEIAFDALKLVIGGKLSASYGEYWGEELSDLQNDFIRAEKTAEQFQTTLNKKLPSCKVCQRGLMIVSAIRLGNKVEPNDYGAEKGNDALLKGKGFTMTEFLAMESEFEGSVCGLPYNNNTDEKLMNICCNIIANGKFVDDDRTDYLVEWKIKKKN